MAALEWLCHPHHLTAALVAQSAMSSASGNRVDNAPKHAGIELIQHLEDSSAHNVAVVNDTWYRHQMTMVNYCFCGGRYQLSIDMTTNDKLLTFSYNIYFNSNNKAI